MAEEVKKLIHEPIKSVLETGNQEMQLKKTSNQVRDDQTHEFEFFPEELAIGRKGPDFLYPAGTQNNLALNSISNLTGPISEIFKKTTEEEKKILEKISKEQNIHEESKHEVNAKKMENKIGNRPLEEELTMSRQDFVPEIDNRPPTTINLPLEKKSIESEEKIEESTPTFEKDFTRSANTFANQEIKDEAEFNSGPKEANTDLGNSKKESNKNEVTYEQIPEKNYLCKQERAITMTSIMDKYADLSPKYNMMLEKKADKDCQTSLYKVALSNGKEFLLRIDILNMTLLKKRRSFLREYKILSFIGNITKYVTKIYDLKEIEIEDGQKIRIESLRDPPGKSIRDYQGKLKRGDAEIVGYQLAQLFDFLEVNGVSHFNLKPDSLYWNSENKEIKLANFGTAISFFHQPTRIMEPIKDCLDRISGWTNLYAAPELMQDFQKMAIGEILIPQKADVFSFGITFAELLCWENSETLEAKRRISLEEHTDFISNIEEKLAKYNKSKWFKIIESCLNYKPTERPTFHQLKDLIQKQMESEACLNINPKPNVDDCKAIAYNYLKDGDNELAIYYYEYCLSLGNDACLLKNCAIAYLRLGMDSQAINLLLQAEKSISNGDFLDIYLKLGEACCNSGEYEKALNYLNKAYSIINGKLDVNDNAFGLLYNLFGCVNQKLANYQEALNNFQKALEIYAKNMGDSHHYVAETYDFIGQLYLEMGNVADSQEYYKKSYEIYNEYYEEPIKEFGKASKFLGNILFATYEYKSAIKAFLNAEMNFRKAYNDDNPYIVNCYNNLGKAHNKIGDYVVALDYLNKANSVIKKTRSDNVVNLAEIYNNLGETYLNMGEYRKGLEYFSKAEQKLFAKLGTCHPGLAKTLINLGDAYYHLAYYNSANANYLKAEDIFLKKLGANNSNLMNVYNKMGKLYNRSELYKDAIGKLHCAEDLSRKLPKFEQPQLVNTYKCLAETDILLGNYVQAGENLAKVELITSANAQAQLDIADTYNLNALLQSFLGKFSLSIEQYELAEDILMKLVNEGHPHIGITYNGLAKIYNQLEQPDKALTLIKIAEGIIKKTYGSNHPFMAETYNNMGESYQQLEDNVLALEYHQKAEQILINSYKETQDLLAKTYVDIGKTYTNLKELDKANNFLNLAQEKYAAREYFNRIEMCEVYLALGDLNFDVEEYKKAFDYFKKALRVYIDISAAPHLNARVLARIGNCYHEQGKNEEALKIYREAESELEKLPKENDKLNASIFVNLAVIMSEKSVTYDLIEYLKKAIEIYQKVDGPDSYEACQAYVLLAQFNSKLDLKYESLECQKEVDKLRKKEEAKRKPELAQAYYNLGVLCKESQDYVQAISKLRKAEDLFSEIGEKAKSSLAQTCAQLCIVHKISSSSNIKANEYQAKAIKFGYKGNFE